MAKPIRIEIIGDDSSIRKAFGNVDSGIGKLLGPLAGVGAAIAGAFAVDRIAGFAGEIASLAVNLGNQTQKISTVFGDQAAEMATWADGLNEQFGVTSTGVQLMAANIADLLKPMGFSTEAAAGMARELTQLSPALAQWSGGTYDAAQVSEILSKALLGERDQLKGLGISINQAEVDARALAVAQAEGRAEATAMDEALATQQLIFEKSTDAQNGYTAGTQTLTGQLNLLKARLAEVKEWLASRVTPALLRVGDYVTGTLAPAFRDRLLPTLRDFAGRLRELADTWIPRIRSALTVIATIGQEAFGWINEHREALVGFGAILAAMFGAWAISAGAAAIATLAAAAPLIALGVAIGALAVLVRKVYNENEGFRQGVDKVADFLKNRLWPALKDVGAWIRDNLIPVLVDVATKIADWSLKAATIAIDIASYFDDIVTAVWDVVTGIGSAAASIYNAVVDPFKSAIQWVVDRWNEARALFGMDPISIATGGGGGRTFEGGGGGRTFGGANPRPVRGSRAWGGDVTGSGWFDVGERGRERVFLPQGARVQPAHAMAGGGSGGDTYNFQAANMSPQELAREIAWRRRTGDGR